jgi:hypothetical protein
MVGRSLSPVTILLLMVALLLAPCCSSTVDEPPRTAQASYRASDKLMIRKLKRSTLALVKEEGPKYTTYCAGVWLDELTAVTAYHCIEPDWIKRGEVKPTSPIADEIILGSKVWFKTYAEAMYADTMNNFTDRGHEARTVAVDRAGDLALLKSMVSVDHDSVHITTEAGDDGERTHVIGHPHNTPFAYSPGIVSGTQFRPTVYGPVGVPMYEIIGFVWYGSSGGGVFNRDGELMGIISTIDVDPSKSETYPDSGPRIGWAIHNLRIRQLLADNHVTLSH